MGWPDLRVGRVDELSLPLHRRADFGAVHASAFHSASFIVTNASR